MSLDFCHRALRAVCAASLLVGVAACKEGIVDPSCELCDEVRVRTDKADYGPKSIIRFTVTNRTSAVVRYDWCSVIAVSRSADNRPFETLYRAHARCGPGAGIVEVLANMRVLAPGASTRDSVTLASGSYQGEYQVQVWPVNATGVILPGGPTVSNSFDVRPTTAP